ncbi:hypothetical protein HYV50_00500 [Candidatus Pacearchaeota archaeon]|nr:hypothetical protein [Candidatus Pacearchaeota archaeon]
MKKINFLIFLFLIVILANFSSAHQKSIQVKINEDGTSTEKILWKIEVKEFFSFFPVGSWRIPIPKEADEIKVSDKYGNLAFSIAESSEKYNLIVFKNSKRIYYTSDYFFNIEYKLKRNPIFYEPKFFYKRTFSRSPTDDSFSLSIALPENSQIRYLKENPLNQYIKDSSIILEYNLSINETKTIEIEFNITGFSPDLGIFLSPEPNLVEINSNYYEAVLPERYANYYASILKKADVGVEFIERSYGFPSPYRWKIEIIGFDDLDFEVHTEGFYLGDGRIRIKTTNLQKTEKEILYTLLHETIHGFNSKFFSESVPNFWWEEGTAQYISFLVLENLSYNMTEEKNEIFNLLESCKNIDKTFISTWSPNYYIRNNGEINCNNTKSDFVSLGYANSYFIVDNIVKYFGNDIFKKFYQTAEKIQINFSSDRSILNNQMNYVLSNATKHEFTSTLEAFGIEVKQVTNQEEYLTPILTGLPILEEDKTNKILAFIIVLTLVVSLIIFLIIKTRK